MKNLLVIMFFSIVSLTSCWEDDVMPVAGGEEGTDLSLVQDNAVHKFTYNELSALSDKPLTVHYIIPSAGDITQMPILFVFPGESCDADIHLGYFVDWAKRNRVMVFAFEYSTTYYPSTTEYILGGINKSQSSVGILSKDKWNFNYVDAVFNDIRLSTKSTQSSYDMWGHSAGAQYVHRFCTFVENSHVNRAIAANSGWYSVADESISFPYGYKEVTDVDWIAQLPKVFARRFYVQLGGNDTNTAGLNNNEGSMVQGTNRLERGKYYFSTSKSIANSKGLPFNWTQIIVPNVGHEPEKMAKAAMELLTY